MVKHGLVGYGDVAFIPAERVALSTLFWPLVKDLLISIARALHGETVYHPKPLLLRYLVSLIDLFQGGMGGLENAVERLVGARPVFDIEKMTLYFEVEGRRLEPQHVSTGMIQLTGLAPFLYGKFAYLIVEEPEINLHANRQLEIADAL